VEAPVAVLVQQILDYCLENFVEGLINVLLTASGAPSVRCGILVGEVLATDSDVLETTHGARLLFQLEWLRRSSRLLGDDLYLAVLLRLFFFAIHYGIVNRIILIFVRKFNNDILLVLRHL
jgi:hypothetical protein